MGEDSTEIATYRVDPRRSRFLVRAFATGMLSAFGHSPTIAIRDFSGEVRFHPESPGDAKLRIVVRADSLEVADEISDRDRAEIERQMREDVLLTAQYQEIVFESRDISVEKIFEGQYGARIRGTLSLRGIQRDLEIESQAQAGGDGMRARGEFSIRQSSFGIKPVSAAGGTIKLKDELKFTFDIVARRIGGGA